MIRIIHQKDLIITSSLLYSKYFNLEKNKADILRLANGKNLGKVEFVQKKVSRLVLWLLHKTGLILLSDSS